MVTFCTYSNLITFDANFVSCIKHSLAYLIYNLVMLQIFKSIVFFLTPNGFVLRRRLFEVSMGGHVTIEIN